MLIFNYVKEQILKVFVKVDIVFKSFVNFKTKIIHMHML